MQLPLSPSPSKGWRDVGSVWRLFTLRSEREKKPEDGQPLYSREKGEASAAASFPSYPFRLSPPQPKASSTQPQKEESDCSAEDWKRVEAVEEKKEGRALEVAT